MLSAGATGSVRVDAKIFFFNLDIHILGKLRPDEHGCKRGVPA
jgi:hypothetical protein